MKKSVVLAILGGTLAAASSYGQGQIFFNSYAANSTAGALTTFFVGGAPVPNGYTAQLYYALGTVNDPVQANAGSILSAISGLAPIGAAQVFNTGPAYPGYFTGAVISIPGYTSGAISFEYLVTGPGYQGRSGSWTMTDINVGASAPGSSMTGMPATFVAATIPEPTTMALAGLGGLASLFMLRRKNA